MLKLFHYKLFIIPFYAALFCLSEYSYRFCFDIPKTRSFFEIALINLVFILLFVFSRYKVTKIIIWLFFTLSIVANNIHYEVYKSWVTSMNYLLAITEVTEATHAGMGMVGKLLLPFLWGAAESLLFLSLFRVKVKRTFRVCDFIFISCLLFICVRSFHTTQQHGISPNPDYSRIKANFFTFGHFIGKILPYYLFNLSEIPYYIKPEPAIATEPKIKNIIFVVGESQNIQHMGAFGYSRDTTPFLSSLSHRSDLILKPTYSAGLMTAIALPSLFNAIERPNGMAQIAKGDTNIFKLAQKQHYHTQFFSAQAERQMMIMNIIGSRWIDNLVFPTQLGYTVTDNMPDFNLIPQLQQIDLDSADNNLVILHQRGSHMPYGALLAPEDNVFGNDTNVDRYDNTIRKTDELLRVVHHYLSRREKDDWILIFTSDHGQYVTSETANQGTTDAPNYSVPTFIYTPNKALQAEINDKLGHCDHLFHQQLSTLIISIMGYDLPVSDCKIGYINGNLLSGDIGYYRINQETNQFEKIIPNEGKN